MKKIIGISVVFFLAFIIKLDAQFIITPKINLSGTPVAFDVAGDGRVFVTYQAGVIQVYDSSGLYLNDFYNLADSTLTGPENGLLGICLDANFSGNHFLYAYYTHSYPISSSNSFIRVVKFTDSLNYGVQPQIILNIYSGSAALHYAGNIHFKNFSDTCLYISIGDLASSSNAQSLSNPFGKILRINKDGSIPIDNPFYDDGNPNAGNDDRIWAYGLRNSFDFTFNFNDSLYATENGNNLFDEVNLITKGYNYGWDICEGFCGIGYTNPMVVFPPVMGGLPALTGIIFYTGSLIPQFTNHLLVSDFINGNISDLTMGNAPYFDTVVSKSVALTVGTGYGLTSMKQMADGSIYVMDRGTYKIYRVAPNNLSIKENGIDVFDFTMSSINNSADFLHVNFIIGKKCKMSFDIFDIYGSKLNSITRENLTKGNYSEEINFKQKSDGMYLCRMKIIQEGREFFSKTKKIILQSE